MIDPLTALRSAIQSSKPPAGDFFTLPEEPDFSYAVSRFLNSWKQAGNFGPDQAVLFRQVLRWSRTSPFFIGPRPTVDNALLTDLENAGIDWGYDGNLRAEPYAPAWLDEVPPCDSPPVNRSLDESLEAESFLQSVSYQKWRSPAQKEAAWAVLNAPPGTTRTIVLPTGSGKSLCFQLLPRFTGGLTVVVVPTVALAIDQQISAERMFGELADVSPVYFAADEDAEATLETVSSKRTRLLFTSPEACVSGRLRPLFDRFAADGWLQNLVIDEAHLVETWGAQFRVEFQILSATRRKWRNASGNRLRTFLFSATMTSECRGLLQELFSDDAEPHEFVCQRLRPEIQYYSHQFSSRSDRDAAVVDALWHLPRPAILYVTEKSDAERFAKHFRSLNFQRLETFHGDTNRRQRREILCRWKDNEIDLMIATSAFGVGVDKQDVRAVVHACFPETLDRYYQEVGRGGRDGWSSVSLLLTAPEDRITAEGITVTLMTPEMIQGRWSAMLESAEHIDNLCYGLPVNARHDQLIGQRTYGENVRWNKRLLLQLKRAGLIELLDIKYAPSTSPDEDPRESVIVKVTGFQPNTPSLASLMKDLRDEELRHFRRGLENLDNFLLGESCAGRLIGNLYGIASDQRACPGCPRCRRLELPAIDCERLFYPNLPSAADNPRSVWVEGLPEYSNFASRVSLVDVISRCITQKGLRQFYCGSEHFSSLLRCFADAIGSNTVEPYRLDPLTLESRLGASTNEPVVFFHFGKVEPLALNLGRPFPSVHLYSGQTTGEGRDIAVNEGFSRWTSPEAWLPEPPNTSLPCLPTIR
jgi:ATP-dependent DNA helicase RecQ